MIGFVKEGASQEILTCHFEFLAFGVLRADSHPLPAANLLAETWNAQATLLADLLAFHVKDFWIDQDELVVRVLAVRDVDDGNFPGHADLRRRQTDAFGRVHRLKHVREELVEARSIELADVIRFALEHGIAKLYN